LTVRLARASIVIRCLNEAAHIGNVIDLVQKQNWDDIEVIAVDSGSTDGTLQILADHDVHVVHIDKDEFSFGRSLNRGCAVASGEFLVFLSAHCYPTDSMWLPNLIEPFDDPKVAVVYGRQRGLPESRFSEQQLLKRWFPDEPMPRQEGPFTNNANSAIRRELWLHHPYDEDLPGLEDLAWAADIGKEGWWVSYQPAATVHHIHSESWTQLRNRYRREAITFQKVFPHEHFNLFDLVRLTFRSVRADMGAAREEHQLRRHWYDICMFRLNQYLGTYQGFHTRWPGSSELKRRFYYPEETQ
jgi:glycosyltransferase involved in cell wall biosynthesis